MQRQLEQQKLQLAEKEKRQAEQQQQRPLCGSCGCKIQQKQVSETQEAAVIKILELFPCLWSKTTKHSFQQVLDGKKTILEECGFFDLRQVEICVSKIPTRYRKEKDRVERSKRSGSGIEFRRTRVMGSRFTTMNC
ncbi:uncharacterized protein LOC131266725 [Anopheles coustani]|uniref:uncharacterized protein LOC131266725 n=1 Tax=Anopheles coustani TaxID=139045 RepID=UPI002659527D|nr:uncharacterized protein LOC131266725 [Anopheles coustani]